MAQVWDTTLYRMVQIQELLFDEKIKVPKIRDAAPASSRSGHLAKSDPDPEKKSSGSGKQNLQTGIVTKFKSFPLTYFRNLFPCFKLM
jgi:hypothetical protein